MNLWLAFRELGIPDGTPCVVAALRPYYARRAIETHPDHGGAPLAFRRVVDAWAFVVSQLSPSEDAAPMDLPSGAPTLTPPPEITGAARANEPHAERPCVVRVYWDPFRQRLSSCVVS